MNAVIYTKDDREYASMAGILREEAEQVDVFRDPLDGHAHYEYPYDIVIVALVLASSNRDFLFRKR